MRDVPPQSVSLEPAASSREVASGAPRVVIEAREVGKSYPGGDGRVVCVLEGASLAVRAGEMVAIVGASGSGKSTFLHVLGGLERPTSGMVLLDGTPVAGLEDELLAALRNRAVGFVFQFHHLLREFSALENVMMPLRIGGRSEREARARAASLLERVGMASRMQHRPAELSGGEQQRAAVARALAASPAVLLADEPSGNLDQGNAERLHDLFAALAQELALGLVVVTHNLALAARADRVLALESGRLVTSPLTERDR
jgi:lipoprotein-releasing system ATP-binding protein